MYLPGVEAMKSSRALWAFRTSAYRCSNWRVLLTLAAAAWLKLLVCLKAARDLAILLCLEVIRIPSRSGVSVYPATCAAMVRNMLQKVA